MRVLTSHHLKVLFFIGFSCLFMAATCNKDDDKPDEPQGAQMTAFDLMGNTGKTWTIMRVERTYYSADGKTDSSVTREFASLDETMWFSKNFGYSEEKEIYFCRFPLNAFIPENGTWTLSNTQKQTLSIACYDLGRNCTTEKDGTWNISDFGKTAYGSSFNIERTLSLVNNRKVKVWAHLYADY